MPLVSISVTVRVYVVGVLFLAFLRTTVNNGYRVFLYVPHGQSRSDRITEINGSFAKRLTLYDGQNYLDIARNGYRRFHPKSPSGNFAWFPLVPAIVWLGDRIGDGESIAIVLNNCCAVVAAVVMWRLAGRCGVAGAVAVVLLSAFPTAVFQSFLYSESIFLLLTVGTTWYVFARKFWIAAMLGLLCGLCRPQGVLVGLIAATQIAMEFRTYSKVRRAAAMTAAAAPVVGLLVFALMCWGSIGSPIAFLQIQTTHGRVYGWTALLHGIADIVRLRWPLTDTIGTLLALGLLPKIWKDLPRPLFVYVVALIVMPLATGTIMSMGRFMSVAFPLFLALAKVLEDRPRWFYTTVSLFLVLQGTTVLKAMKWEFVG